MKKVLFFIAISYIAVISLRAQNSPLLSGASFSNASLNDPFFEVVNFRGAFGSVDWTQGWTNFDPQNTNYPSTNVTINAGDITSNTTWTSNNVYLLNGWVYVKSGATLTIEAGTIIRGDKTNKGSLIIEKGAKLIANGTASNPIVFTSNQAAGSRDYGDWGGLIILGNAVINVPGGSATIEGGVGSTYGGNDDNDNSGILKFLRVEFPGIAFAANNEINGITFGGIGSGTEVDYIQVSYSGDDSFEWFGGNVNAKHLVSYRGWDDDFDTDFGFRGKIQYAVALRDKNIADVSGSNGFESDNDGSGSTNTPITKPIFSNFTLIGPLKNITDTIHSNYKRAMHLRRNTKLNVFNSVFSGWPVGLFIDGSASQSNATNDELRIENCVLVGMTNFFASQFERNYFTTNSRNNDTMATTSMMMLVDPFNMTNPNFLPVNTSSVNEIQSLDAQIYSFNNNIFIKLNSQIGCSNIEIFNINGQIIYSSFLCNDDLNSFRIGDTKGIYIVRISNNEKFIVRKIFVN